MSQRDHGGQAFARPASEMPNGNYICDETGMSYRDWLVGGMMREFFKKAMERPSATMRLASALVPDIEVREAVERAHHIADIVMEERYK